jgi:type IX secretion system PorP/SprF family membrane protein
MIFLRLNLYPNKMKHSLMRITLFIGLCIAALPVFAQQDPQYSLYMFDKMALNPAAAGSKDALEATIISRAQWLGIGAGAPITNAIMLQAPMANKNFGWGVELMNDRIGPTNTTSIQGNYAYQLRLGNGRLAMGLGIGLYDYVIDFSKVDYKDQTDPYALAGSSQKLTPTAEFGLYYYNQSFYAGLSFNHLIASKFTNIVTDSAAAFSEHTYFILGKAWKLSDNVILNPSVVLMFAQNAPATGDININVLLSQKLWLGLSFRQNYGTTIMAAFKASAMLQIGYAYDAGFSGFNKIGGGANEISLIFDFATRKAVQMSPRYL